jgi:hypothetical protein
MSAARERIQKIYVLILASIIVPTQSKIVAFVDDATGHVVACIRQDEVSDVMSVVYVNSSMSMILMFVGRRRVERHIWHRLLLARFISTTEASRRSSLLAVDLVIPCLVTTIVEVV